MMMQVQLAEICELVAGQSPPSSSYNQEQDGVPFFQGKADFGELYPRVRYWCTEPKKMSIPGDILFSVRAPVGPTNINNIDACLGRGLCAIRCTDKVIQKYLLHYLRANEHKIAALGTGSTFKAITIKELKLIPIPLPPLEEQKQIAAILDAADELRQKDKALIAKYDALTQSLFLDMFGDPVTNPKGWETSTIESLIDSRKGALKRGPFGGALKKEIFVDEGYLVYEQFHALNNDFTMARYFIDENKFNELRGFEVKPGDIIISCSGVYLGKLAIVPENARKGIINQALLKITLNPGRMTNILFTYIFRDINFKRKFFGYQRGSGVPNFPPMSTFKRFEFICPPIKLQIQFSDQIGVIESQKAIANESLHKSEALFNSLLQKAFKRELTS